VRKLLFLLIFFCSFKSFTTQSPYEDLKIKYQSYLDLIKALDKTSRAGVNFDYQSLTDDLAKDLKEDLIEEDDPRSLNTTNRSILTVEEFIEIPLKPLFIQLFSPDDEKNPIAIPELVYPVIYTFNQAVFLRQISRHGKKKIQILAGIPSSTDLVNKVFYNPSSTTINPDLLSSDSPFYVFHQKILRANELFKLTYGVSALKENEDFYESEFTHSGNIMLFPMTLNADLSSALLSEFLFNIWLVLMENLPLEDYIYDAKRLNSKSCNRFLQ
jgi:hypothetical protein